jgi:hypothetical protein
MTYEPPRQNPQYPYGPPPGQQPQQPRYGAPQQYGMPQQYGPPGGPPPGYRLPQPPRPPRKRHPARTTAIIVASIVVVFIVGAVASAKTPKGQHHGTVAAAAPAPAAATHPAKGHRDAPTTAPVSSPPPVTVTRTVKRVVFIVTGSAPGGAQITYGSDSENLSPPGGAASPPWHASVPLNLGALYYAVSAQLQGSGNISCRVVLRVTRYWSDGTHESASRVLATGRAENSYNICQAQFNND